MKSIFTLLAFISLLLISGKNSFAKERAPIYTPNEAIVLYKSKTVSITTNSFIKSLKTYRALSKNKKGTVAVVKANLPTDQLIAKLKKDPNVVAVFPNFRRELKQIPDDNSFSELWGLHNTGQSVNGNSGRADADIDAPEAWDKSIGSRDIIVAVIDTGIDYTHEDLAANMWKNSGELPNNGIDDDNNGYIDDYYGYDFASDQNGNNDPDPMDFMGHGSHVAGTIGAEGNNAKGITGVNWSVSIMALKAARPDGSLYDSDILEAMDYILTMKNRGLNIVSVNASYGGPGPSSIVKDSIDALGTAGIIFVAAAGNENSDIDINPSYPASYTSANLVSVAATDQNDQMATFSNYGATSVDLAAPGQNIYSSLPGGDFIPKRGDIFFDDMESNDSLWIHGGTNDSWQITSEEAWSGSYAWSDSPNGDYVPDSNSSLTIKNSIDLSAYDPQRDHIFLAFWAKFRIEESYDNLWIEISKDGGSTWEKIDTKSDSSYSYYWNLYSYTIPPSYWSSSFKFRFHFVSDGDFEYDGVYLDDIGVGVANPAKYTYYDGTSMATPHVAGAVALVRSIYPNKTVAEIKSRILNNVDKLSTLSGKVSTGGRLNIANALTNHLPSAQDDSAATDTNKSVTIDVVANDNDPDGDILTLDTITSAPSHGNATIGAGNIIYTPQNGYEGSDTFKYRVDDGSGGKAEAQVFITVGTPPNRVPDAKEDSVIVQQDSSATINVLTNDSDPDGDALSITSVSLPSHGSASISGNGIIYTPNSGYIGSDSFTYTVTDGKGGSDTATVSVIVNGAPDAKDDTSTTRQDSSVTINVLTNDSDPDGDALSITSVSLPSHGSASISGNGIIYTPNSGYIGSDSFTYTVTDGKGGSDTATVSIIVTAKASGGGGGFDLTTILTAVLGFLIISLAAIKREEMTS